jgi:hypothetical protein
VEQNGWIALGAASALGLGLLAGGAVTAATAMPLVDSSTSIDVAGISDVSAGAKHFAGAGEGRVTVPGSSPGPSSSPTASPTASAPTASPAEPEPAPTVTQAPVPQPAPAAPVPVTSPPSPVTPDDDDDSSDD